MLLSKKKSSLYYNYEYNNGVDPYYQTIVKLIEKIFENNPELNVNINLCNKYKFNNSNKTLSININYEHTLVRKGGRGVPLDKIHFGEIDYDENEKYLVRIHVYEELSKSDIVIDYSNPNIYNVRSCPVYDSFSEKQIYISSSIYENYFIKENRNITTLTTFIIPNERRDLLLTKINYEKIHHTNINNCFEKDKLQNIFKSTKILINIHQTPHHHTFEELRVLPALECGVIVISEKSPLNEIIPYNDLIIWANYDDIIEKVKEVIENYDFYHNKIFSTENKNLLCSLQKVNYDVLENAILQKSKL